MTVPVIIDYGSGNVFSLIGGLKRALRLLPKHLQPNPDLTFLSDDPAIVRSATHIFLPGQGSFAFCYQQLRAKPKLYDALEEKVLGHKTPFLGICVGMQLLMTLGVEGVAPGEDKKPGLGWLDGETEQLTASPSVPVPNMGWRLVRPTRPHPLLTQGEQSEYYFFANSFITVPSDSRQVLALTDYGRPFASIIGRDNVVGVQFHPEKSHRGGIRMLSRFLAWKGTEPSRSRRI